MIHWRRHEEDHASLHDNRDLDAFLRVMTPDVVATPPRGLPRGRRRVSIGRMLGIMAVAACVTVSILFVQGEL
ncbi:hypothetical protein [Pandoraea oxalativorans]|uniref:Uncharacterized protein n=1 Tax=Pandoraea oxalativorans TaxID=573737 RepID=A0A0G3IIF1_9BURK|nr:hypothetical protein [Pandoraea oxalativorans]AKK24885.1 hypothetical protein MB84_29410 [Pandoraea oxalativorans]